MKVIVGHVLCAMFAVAITLSADEGGEERLDVSVGKVTEITFVEDEEFNNMHKIEIDFRLNSVDQVNKPCILYHFVIEPVDNKDRKIFEPQKPYRLGSKEEKRGGAIGVIFGVVPADYSGNADNVLIVGKEYRVWSSEYKGSAVFKVPTELSKRDDLRVIWYVDKGRKPSESVRPKITGTMSDSLLNDMESSEKKYTVRYVNPSTGYQQTAAVENGSFELRVNEMGGELIVMQRSGGHVVIYKSSVATESLSFPRDADRVFLEEEEVKYAIKCDGSVFNKMEQVCVFVDKNDVLPVKWYEKESFIKDEKSDSWTRTLSICPGKYWIKFCSMEGEEVNVYEEHSIEVKSE